MAKIKDNPSKNKKPTPGAKAASSPAPPLRRSPRKAVESAKSLGPGVAAASPRAVKKSSSTNKSKPKKPPRSTRKTADAAIPANSNPKSSIGTCLASAVGNTDTTATPKRGRPRKEASAASTTPKAPSATRVTKSVGRPKKQADASPVVAAPKAKEIWTDSPKKKKSPRKPAAKLSTDDASAVKQLINIYEDARNYTRARQASLGGIRKSIEAPSPVRETRSRRSSKSPARTASKSPVRKPPAVSRRSAEAREASMRASKSAGRSRSRSPAKVTKQRGRGGTFRDASSRKSPKQSSVARSKSPGKAPTSQGTARSRSPTPRSAWKRRTELEELRQAAIDLRVGHEESDLTHETAPSRSPSISASEKVIRNTKTRSLRRPVKSPTRSPVRSRHVSPIKPSASREISGHPETQSKSPLRSSSIEPARTSCSLSRHSPAELAFVSRFEMKDEYGRALRRIESHAYKSTKPRSTIGGHNPMVSREDERKAQERGIRRAELQMGLNTVADNKEQRAPGSNDGIVCLPVDQQRRSEGRQPSAMKQQTPKPVMFVEEEEGNDYNNHDDEDDCEIAAPTSAPPLRGSASPPKLPRRQSPMKKTTRTQSSIVRPASGANNITQPLRLGEPSASGRGAIRSVTNPEFINGTQKRNPFFETMPAQEVWHRNMPRYFPFGETPFMQREMSRQISEDLARGKDQQNANDDSNGGLLGRATTAIRSGLSAVGQSIWGGSPSKESLSSPPWELPEVTESEVGDVFRDMQAHATIGQKRKGSGDTSPPKRVRRRSNVHLMSGALG